MIRSLAETYRSPYCTSRDKTHCPKIPQIPRIVKKSKEESCQRAALFLCGYQIVCRIQFGSRLEVPGSAPLPTGGAGWKNISVGQTPWSSGNGLDGIQFVFFEASICWIRV